MEDYFNNFNGVISNFIKASKSLPFPILVILSFGGGLAASLTPCVLSMLPLNLSYIGTANIGSKTDAFKKAFLFVLGTAITFSLMGVFASFASFITVEYKGYVDIIIGLLILFMALSVLEVIKFPLPQFITHMPHGGPFLIGIAFALISSPCASPILFAVLALSSTSGSILNSTLIMTAYSFGYTAVIFITSLFAGIAKQLNFFKTHSRLISIISAVVLGLLGTYYLYIGIRWFVG